MFRINQALQNKRQLYLLCTKRDLAMLLLSRTKQCCRGESSKLAFSLAALIRTVSWVYRRARCCITLSSVWWGGQWLRKCLLTQSKEGKKIICFRTCASVSLHYYSAAAATHQFLFFIPVSHWSDALNVGEEAFAHSRSFHHTLAETQNCVTV